MKRLFHILNGNNSATYIICCKSFENIKEGLRFYRPVNLSGKLKKIFLIWVLWKIGKLKLKTLKTLEEVNAYCSNLAGKKIDFNLSENISVLVSPTRDKIIVNFHKQYFHKFAFGNSYSNVKNEIEVYNLLNSPDSFTVSKISEIKKTNDFCSFKLTPPTIFLKSKLTPKPESLSKILVEFFNKVSLNFTKWQDYTFGLKDKLQNSTLCDALVLEKFNSIVMGNFKLPLGMVHRDFKPWNILCGSPLLIYDFEETIFDGPPLEDFYNFYIDPIVRYKEPKYVLSVINKSQVQKAIEDYIKNLNIKIPGQHLLITFLVERILFWESRKDLITANHFANVFKAL